MVSATGAADVTAAVVVVVVVELIKQTAPLVCFVVGVAVIKRCRGCVYE
jgi:hypothetical protein